MHKKDRLGDRNIPLINLQPILLMVMNYHYPALLVHVVVVFFFSCPALSGMYFSAAPEDIPDLGTLSAEINVAETIYLTDVNVWVSTQHPDITELSLHIVSPGGTQISLSSRNGAPALQYAGAKFSDQAEAFIHESQPPYYYSYKPEQPLSPLNGENGLGGWHLLVVDHETGNTGRLQSWAMELDGGSHPSQLPANLAVINMANGHPLTATLAFPDTNVDGSGNAMGENGFAIINTGTTPITIVSTDIVFDNGSTFTLLPVLSNTQGILDMTGPVTLAPFGMEGWVFPLIFDPAQVGKQLDYLTVTSSDFIDSPLRIPLEGTGLPLGDLQLILPAGKASANFIDFGQVPEGEASRNRQTLVLQNIGSDRVFFTAASFTFAQNGSFDIISILSNTKGAIDLASGPASIEPFNQEEWTITLAMESSNLGSFTNNFHITPQENGIYREFFTIGLKGRVQQPQDIAIRDSAGTPDDRLLDFQTIIVDGINGHVGKEKVFISNSGELPLTFLPGSIQLNTGSPFRIEKISSNLQGAVPVGGEGILAGGNTETWVIDLIFDPEAAGAAAASLTITSNDPDDGYITLFLTGEGSTNPVLELTDPGGSPLHDIEFPPTLADGIDGAKSSLVLTIRNNGTAPLTIAENGIDLSGDVFSLVSIISSTDGPVTLATGSGDIDGLGNEEWQITISFDPDSPVSQEGLLTITTAGQSVTSHNYLVQGEGIVPTVTLLYPATDLHLDTKQALTFRWSDEFPGGDARISLSLDDDQNSENGVRYLIVADLSEDSPEDRYSWNPESSLAGGSYYICAAIEAGGITAYDYSTGRLHLKDNDEFNILSSRFVTSHEYTYLLMINGSQYTGSQSLTPGQNVISVATGGSGEGESYQFEVFYAPTARPSNTINYDNYGRIDSVRDGRDILTTLSYDIFGRLNTIAYSTGEEIRYQFDTAGRLSSVEDSLSRIEYSYDDLDRITRVLSSNSSSPLPPHEISYEYDLAGRLTAIVYPGGQQVDYAYDAAGRVIAVHDNTSGQPASTTYLYYPVTGQLQKLTRPNGVTTSYTYDGGGRVTEITHSSNTDTLLSHFQYTYNPAGLRRTLKVVSLDPENSSQYLTQTVRFSYDKLRRLVEAATSVDDIFNDVDTYTFYTYDENGNRTAKSTQTGTDLQEDIHYLYGSGDRLLQQQNLLTGAVTRYFYDEAGNLIQKQEPGKISSYEYDERNYLHRIFDGEHDITYTYDVQGNRTAKVIDGRRTEYVVDPLNSTPQVLAEYDGAGTLISRYVYGTERLSRRTADQAVSYYLTDGRATVYQQIDDLGVAGEASSYSPFGLPAGNPEAAGGYGFAGEQFDAETGLIYLRARYYDPQLGRFISEDPLGLAAGLNRYLYAGNNPVNYSDPSGLIKTSDIIDLTSTLFDLAGVEFTGSDIIPSFLKGAETTIKLGLNINEPVNALVSAMIDMAISISKETLPKFAKDKDKQNFIKNTIHITATSILSSSMAKKLGISVLPKTLLGNMLFYFSWGKAWYHIGDYAFIKSGFIDYKYNFTAHLVEKISTHLFYRDLLEPQNGYSEMDFMDFPDPIARPRWRRYQPPAGVAPEDQDRIVEIPPASFNPGGVLIDRTAELIGDNLADIVGATYDPASKQMVFLGSNAPTEVHDINMDYFKTAIQAVYGSAVPPFVTLDSPAYILLPPFDMHNMDGYWQPGESVELIFRYTPIWISDEDDMRLRFRLMDTVNDTYHGFSADIDARVESSGDRLVTRLYDTGLRNAPAGINLLSFNAIFHNFELPGSEKVRQDSLYRVVLQNNSQTTYDISQTLLIPDKQHRKFGGRVDNTLLGWVMYEADRVMKCLTTGEDTLTGAQYDSSTIQIDGFYNILERIQSGWENGELTRLWFVPDEMQLQRNHDPATGKSTIVYAESRVALRTEAYLTGEDSGSPYQAFAQHFNDHYNEFASLEFPVQDPYDPTGQTIMHVPIFSMLEDAMQAVSFARFMRDHEIPMDMWWLNSWQAPVAHIPQMIDTATREEGNENSVYWALLFGGVELKLPNSYLNSSAASSLGDQVTAERPAGHPGDDLLAQAWDITSLTGVELTAVASSLQASNLDNALQYAATDLVYASPGVNQLNFTRHYNSAYPGTNAMGPGWSYIPYRLEFSRPSWYDEQGLMHDSGNNRIWSDDLWDTRLHSGTVRLLSSGEHSRTFQSSLELDNRLDYFGNVRIILSGLTADNVPAFTANRTGDGAQLFQNNQDYGYRLSFTNGSELHFDYEGKLLSRTDTYGYTSTYTYNAQGQLISIADSLGQTLTLSYNGSGEVEAVTGPQGEQVDFSYDDSRRLIAARHVRSGHQTSYAYGDAGRLQRITRHDGVVVMLNDYDLKGRVTDRTDNFGNLFRYDYSVDDTTLRQTTSMEHSGAQWSRTFDEQGRLRALTSANGNRTSYGYYQGSSQPNFISGPLPDREQTRIERNSAGLPVEIYDPAIIAEGGQPLRFTYDDNNLLIRFIDTIGRITEYSYNQEQDLVGVTRYLNGEAVEINILYENGNITAITDPTERTLITCSYDTFGRITAQTDATGVTTTYAYDNLGRLSSVDHPALLHAVRYLYNDFDQITAIETPTGTMQYRYDPQTGWLVEIADAGEGVWQLAYDPTTGSLTSITVPDVDGRDMTINYALDSSGKLSQLTYPNGRILHFLFNDNGSPSGEQFDTTEEVCRDVSLMDTILSLQIMAGDGTQGSSSELLDINGDYRIGLEESVYFLNCLQHSL